MTDRTDPQPDNLLTEVALALLAPMLMVGSITNITLARRAAQQAIDAYTVGNRGPAVAIAQIVAFAVMALDSLRLSVAADISRSAKLKLRANAIALSRSSKLASQTVEKTQQETTTPSLAEQAAMASWEDPDAARARTEPARTEPARTEPASIESAIIERASIERASINAAMANPANAHPAIIEPADNQPADIQSASPAPASSEQQNRLHWATAMEKTAVDLQADVTQSPSAQRKVNMLWAEVLTSVADDLKLEKCPTPRPSMSRADLLRSTVMTPNCGFPPQFGSEIHRSPTSKHPGFFSASRAARRPTSPG
jgi:hypothetical protein